MSCAFESSDNYIEGATGLFGLDRISGAAIEAALDRFRGEISQVLPVCVFPPFQSFLQGAGVLNCAYVRLTDPRSGRRKAKHRRRKRGTERRRHQTRSRNPTVEATSAQ